MLRGLLVQSPNGVNELGGPKNSNQAARTRFQACRYKRHTRVILDGATLQWIGWWGTVVICSDTGSSMGLVVLT
jgi:hypothetical protein